MFKIQSTSNNKLTFSLHVIAWIIVISIPIYINSLLGDKDLSHMYQAYVNIVSAMLIFYLGYFWLVPKFFLKEKKLTYVLILTGIILASYLFTFYINDILLFNPVDDAKFQDAIKEMNENNANIYLTFKIFGFFRHILISILISGFSIGLGVMEKLKQNEKNQKELEKEKLNSELAFLKNQVSPHFFFNTLNNIYSLIGIDGPTAQDSVLKLSKLMRYLLYESEHGETLMSHEIDFMNNYIDLMKLRISPRVNVQIDFPKDFSDFSIPPLLFIPFIENAFKHGISYSEASYIQIRMRIENEKIHFFSENSIGKANQNGETTYSGIGLENVKKRLNLLFEGKHDLNITQNDKIYSVRLSINKGNFQT